ncbi:MAG: DUF3299 domain-containing protein [Candidatus Hydrogenedentota bacterium]
MKIRRVILIVAIVLAGLAGFQIWSGTRNLASPDGSIPIDFQHLDFYRFEVTDLGETHGVIPDSVRDYDGQKITIQGYMMPLDMDGDKALSFMLARDQQMCCYGVTPPPNGWIYAEMPDSGTTDYVIDYPILVTGTLEVGERYDEEGIFLSLYRMRVEKVHLPENMRDLTERMRNMQQDILDRSASR